MHVAETLGIDGSFWLLAAGTEPASRKRIALLEGIAASGSISQAARDIGMSYKAAWQAVDSMNNLSAAPLVERSIGGRHGGGTRLTAEGRQLIEIYRQVEAEFQGFLARIERGIADFPRFNDLMMRLGMQTSARNELAGTITKVTKGAVNSEVVLDLGGGDGLVAIITNTSVENLGLKPGGAAYALIKAPWVILTTTDGLRTSARNHLSGKLAEVIPGAVNAEVTVALAGGKRLTAIVTMESVKDLGLKPGVEVSALIKASQVIIAVSA